MNESEENMATNYYSRCTTILHALLRKGSSSVLEIAIELFSVEVGLKTSWKPGLSFADRPSPSHVSGSEIISHPRKGRGIPALAFAVWKASLCARKFALATYCWLPPPASDISRAISRQAPVTHVSQPRSVTAPAPAPASAPLLSFLVLVPFLFQRLLVWVSLTLWKTLPAWHARHVDKRRQRCQRRHRRIYANQLWCPEAPELQDLDVRPSGFWPRGLLGHFLVNWGMAN